MDLSELGGIKRIRTVDFMTGSVAGFNGKVKKLMTALTFSVLTAPNGAV